MNRVLFVFLVLSISGCLQNALAQPNYSYWETCRENLIEFSLWFNSTEFSNYSGVRSLEDCYKFDDSYESLLQCGEEAISRIHTEQIDVVHKFFDNCIMREFLYYQNQEPDFQKCYKSTQRCMACLTEDKDCNTFKLYKTERNIAYSNARKPSNCVELESCNEAKIGFLASGYCALQTEIDCGNRYILTHTPFDKCIGMELCDPYKKQLLDFDSLGEDQI